MSIIPSASQISSRRSRAYRRRTLVLDGEVAVFDKQHRLPVHVAAPAPAHRKSPRRRCSAPSTCCTLIAAT